MSADGATFGRQALVAPALVRSAGGWGLHLGDGDVTKHSRYEPSRLQVRFCYVLGRSGEADAGCA